MAQPTRSSQRTSAEERGQEWSAKIVLISESKQECWESLRRTEKMREQPNVTTNKKEQVSRSKTADAGKKDDIISINFEYPLKKRSSEKHSKRSYHYSDPDTDESDLDDSRLDPDFKSVSSFSDSESIASRKKKSKNVKRSKTTKAQLKQPKTAKQKLDPEANAAKKAKIKVLNKQSQEIVKQTSCLKAEFTFYDKETKPAKRFTLDIFIDTKLADVKKLASDIINLPADSILVIFKGQVLNKEELEFIRQWDGKGGISCVAKRKDPRKDAASNLFSHQEVMKDSINHAPKHHHQEVNKPSHILQPLRSKSSPLPLVPTPSSPVVPKPASVTPSASPVASLAVPVTPTAASLTPTAASLTPTAAPITSATRCVMESTKELSASHDPVGNVMGNLSRLRKR